MSDDSKTVCWVIRSDQDEFVKFLAKHMGVPISAIGRWAIDDARASLLLRASLKESDLPQETRRAA